MTDDIVTRLRKLSAYQKAHRFGDLMEDWSGEAADEIEHLRNESDEWKRQAMFWHDQASKLALEGLSND